MSQNEEYLGWSLKALREHVAFSIKDKKKNFSLMGSISSMDRAVMYYRYHIHLAKNAVDEMYSNVKRTDFDALNVIFGAHEKQSEIELSRLVASANYLAAVHVLRGMYDIFASLSYDLTNSSGLERSNLYLHNVIKTLPDSELRRELESLVSLEGFKYIAAFVNTSKHQQLISSGTRVALDKFSIELRISHFKYKQYEYPNRKILDAILETVDIKNHILKCGRALNAFCGVRLDEKI